MKEVHYGPQQVVLAAEEGDIFWDLAPYVTYIAGATIGATIYVANPSDIAREYALIANLYGPDGNSVLEESVTVFSHAWFDVEAGSVVKLRAELNYDYTNVILAVSLIERSTDSVVDAVQAYLVAPSQGVPGFPIGGGGIGGGIGGGGDTSTNVSFMMSSMMDLIMMVMMLSIMASMIKDINADRAES